MSGRLVAAMSITPLRGSKPSISTSNWLRVCSRSSCPPPSPAPRWRPTASISSTNTIAGAVAFAFSNSRGHDSRRHPRTSRRNPTRDGEERHARFTRDRASQQRLAGAGGPVQEDALGDLGPHRLEPRRVLEELLDLLELLDGFVATGDVREGDPDVGVAVLFRLRLAEVEDAVASLHRVHQQEEQTEQQQDGQQGEQQRDPDRLLLLIDVELDVRGGELRRQLVAVLLREVDRVRRAVAELAADLVVVILQRGVRDVAGGDLALVLGERELLRTGSAVQPQRSRESTPMTAIVRYRTRGRLRRFFTPAPTYRCRRVGSVSGDPHADLGQVAVTLPDVEAVADHEIGGM